MFEDADRDFDLVYNLIKAGRSLAASYNVQNNIQCKWHSVTAHHPKSVS